MLPLEQHLQTIHNTQYNDYLQGTGSSTTQHSGDEPVQEDVFWFPLPSTNKAI